MPDEEKPLIRELGEALAAAILELSILCNSNKLLERDKGTARVVIGMLERVEKRIYGAQE